MWYGTESGEGSLFCWGWDMEWDRREVEMAVGSDRCVMVKILESVLSLDLASLQI